MSYLELYNALDDARTAVKRLILSETVERRHDRLMIVRDELVLLRELLDRNMAEVEKNLES